MSLPEDYELDPVLVAESKRLVRQAIRRMQRCSNAAIRSPETWRKWRSETVRRNCDGCSACCTVFHIVELDILPEVTCPHDCGTGCAIYDTRPPGCQAYYCSWMTGVLPEEWKPDQCGFIIDLDSCMVGSYEVQAVHLREARPGVLEAGLPDTQLAVMFVYGLGLALARPIGIHPWGQVGTQINYYVPDNCNLKELSELSSKLGLASKLIK